MIKHYKNLAIGLSFLFLIAAGLWCYKNYHSSPIPDEYQIYVNHYTKEYHLDPSLVYGVIKTESNFNPHAKSHRNAHGLMQITEDTLKWALLREGNQEAYTAEDLYDPKINIKYGCFILSLFLEEFNDTDTALAAYNAGRSNAKKWLKDGRYSEDGIHLHTTPYEETNQYIKKVLKHQQKYKKQLGETV